MNGIIELSNRSITLDSNAFLKVNGSIDINLFYIENGMLRF
tara:strand:- start:222 stop:344 length:123 start_codon:yes stop_codon:yes gene_type:complete